MDDRSALAAASHSTARKFSSNSWPLIRNNSPWEVDEESEFMYHETLLHYAEKLQIERSRMQTRLDQYVPMKGPYANCKGHYLKICQRPKDNNGIYTVRLNEDAKSLFVGYENGFIEMIDLVNECSVPMKLAVGSNHPPSAIRFNPKRQDHIYISTTTGLVFLCSPEPPDYDTWTIKKIITEGKNETYAMDICNNGEKLITAGKDCRIRVYDMETNDLVSCYKGFTLECKDSYSRLLEEDEQEGHYLNIYSVVCHPDNPWMFASAGLDSNIKIWDLRVKQFAVKNICGPHIMGDSIDLKDNKVLSGQWASSEGLQIWDGGSCRLLKTFAPTNMCPQSFGQYFYCAKFLKGSNEFSTDDLVIAGGAGLGGLIVGSFNENLILALYEEDGSILCLDNQGDTLAYGGTNHVLYLSQFQYGSNNVPSDSELGSSAAYSTVNWEDSLSKGLSKM